MSVPKKRAVIFLLAGCLLFSVCLGEGLLPDTSELFGVMPSFGKALKIPCVSDAVQADGSRTLVYEQVYDREYAVFNSYLAEYGCELQSYTGEGGVFTFTLLKGDRSFSFVYDTATHTATLNYPAGTLCEEFDYAAYAEEQAAAADEEREEKLMPFKLAGSIVAFGTYPQTALGTDSTPIEWLVLDHDAEHNKTLLISRYALDVQPYSTQGTEDTWDSCSLRGWLNGEFLNRAFTKEEQKALVTSKVTADKNPKYDTYPGSDTEDRVFLLSVPQAQNYLSRKELLKCIPTDYVVKLGVWRDEDYMLDGCATCAWCLRTPGFRSDTISEVHNGGWVECDGEFFGIDKTFAIRPAMWICLEQLP